MVNDAKSDKRKKVVKKAISDTKAGGAANPADLARTKAHRADSVAFNVAHALRHAEEARASASSLVKETKGDKGLQSPAKAAAKSTDAGYKSLLQGFKAGNQIAKGVMKRPDMKAEFASLADADPATGLGSKAGTRQTRVGSGAGSKSVRKSGVRKPRIGNRTTKRTPSGLRRKGLRKRKKK